MIEANKIDNGNTKGTIVGQKYNTNLTMVIKSKSLPANSAMKSQILCKMKIKNKMTNTEAKVIKKDFKIYLSIIFTRTSRLC
jgi:hypothetical protein